PNGCGKSNVGEAVRWALGEQSAKSLRGQRMEDLIFHGSQSRKPVGLAEVELTFRNDGTLSVPWAEVSVARRLYRTGESEYLLNGGAARLRDILDLFAGTGANPRAYSVMDQDKLNHVLTAKPHERRVFIEEAAGIARYKQQRERLQESDHRLSDLRQSVQKVQGELERLLERREQMGLQLRELGEEAVRLDEEIRATADRLAAIVGEREAGRQALADASRLAAEGARTADALAAGLERHREALAAERGRAEAEAALANARVALAAHRSSLDALAALERAREGYGAGVRAVFDQGRAAALAGVVGTVADLLEVPAGMERAIEAVLGERLQWVVVERFEHARAAVEYLRAHSLGAATFLPLEHLPPPPGPQPDANGVRWVARSVAASSLSLVHHLLGQVAIVEHLDQAEALWRRNGVVATYVTPAGEVLGPTGRLHGGGQAPAAEV